MNALPVFRLVAAIALILPTVGYAQSKVPVYLHSTVATEDNVGRLVVFEIKEAIRGSQGFRLVEDRKQWPYLKWVVIAMRATTVAGRDLNSTALSHSFLFDSTKMPLLGAYITGTVSICSGDQAALCARSLLSNLDSALEELQRQTPELRGQLK